MGYFRSFPVYRRLNFVAHKNLNNMKKYLSLNFRADWFEAIETFPEDRQIEAYRAIMRYSFYGEIPSDPSIKMAIGLIMLLIDKRRAARKPKQVAPVDAPTSVQSDDTPTGSAECADVATLKHAPAVRPKVVKSAPVHNFFNDSRRTRRAVCRSDLSDDRSEPHL